MVSVRISCDVCKVSKMRWHGSSLVQGNTILSLLCCKILVTSATKDNLQDRHFDVPVFERIGTSLPGERLYHNLVNAQPETVAICHIRTAIHSKNQDNDIFAPITSINAAGSVVPISSTIKTLDSHLTFEAHVKSITKTCYFHIRELRHIRSSINLDTAKSVTNAIVSSQLDYANSLLFGISGSNMLKLQCVQNSLARVVLATTHTHTDDALNVLHWLPIHHCISFKIASLTKF